MHLEARKTIPKMGKCFNCKVEKERVDLSVCNRCMVMQYCSRECQVAAWPSHKLDCDVYREKELELEIKEVEQIHEELKTAKGLLAKKVVQSEKLKQIEERLSKLQK